MQMKRIVGLLLSAVLLVGLVTGCSATNESATKDVVVATYTQGALNQADLTKEVLSKSGMQVMLDMVDQSILDGVEPVSEDMAAMVESDLTNIKDYYKDDFEDSLKINGFENEEAFKTSLLLNAQRSTYTLKYIASTILTEEEIATYYENYEPSIEASHILITPTDDTEAAQLIAKKKAEDLTSRIENGENFADLAKEFSEDPGSGANGGALGSFSKGQMVPEFETAAFNLEIGEVTKTPIKSQFGYHIIKRTGGEEKTTLEDMKEMISNNLASEKLQNDPSLTYKALFKLRTDNGFEIKDENIANQYLLFSNQINKEAK